MVKHLQTSIQSRNIHWIAFFIVSILFFLFLMNAVILPAQDVFAQAPGTCQDDGTGSSSFCFSATDEAMCLSAVPTCEVSGGGCIPAQCNLISTQPSCTSIPHCVWVPPPVCSDWLDNDGDKRIDFPNDPGCTDATDDDETNLPPPPATFFVSPISHTFPPTTIGSPDTFSFQIQNTGAAGAPSIVGSVAGLLSPFSCIGGACVYSIGFGESRSPTIQFDPIVASPPSFSDIATFTVNPGVDSPLCSATQAEIPRNTACGLYLDSIGQGVIIKMCQGLYNPQVSCPLGFAKIGQWYFEDGHAGYQAVCYRDGSGPPSPGGAYTCGIALQSWTLGWVEISCESSNPYMACPVGYTQVGPWYFQDSTFGEQAVCVGNDTILSANDFAPGAHCGLLLNKPALGQKTIVPCLGHNPEVSCPAGFDRVYWFYEGEGDQGYRGVCIKQ